MLVSKLIGSGVDNTYAKLIPLLEGIHVVNWAFQTFDMESTCKINYKFEGPNRLFLDVNVLSLGNFNLEFKKWASISQSHIIVLCHLFVMCL